MVAIISLIESALNFFVNVILIFTIIRKYLNFATFSDDLRVTPEIWHTL
jgi:hypothetical protein